MSTAFSIIRVPLGGAPGSGGTPSCEVYVVLKPGTFTASRNISDVDLNIRGDLSRVAGKFGLQYSPMTSYSTHP